MSDHEKEKLLQQLKDAIVAIRKLKTDLKEEKLRNSEEIAIIGMSMRFPGEVNNAESYWKLLTSGTDAITDIPKDRFDANALYDPQPGTAGKINVRQGGFIKDVDLFDGSFFDITPVEIESTDPQQRLLLELTHEALENAGQDVGKLVGSDTGVYVGISSNDYTSKHFRSGDYNLVGPYSYTGAAISANSGRISYMMGFQGPSLTLDTACSSTIVTAHLAMKALRSKECGMAVVGGANLMLEPEMTLCFSNLSALSPDSRCKTFDDSANGYVRSEGAAMMVLKRLSDAQRDGDNILAVIKGSAINQDGRSNGFTAPNVAAQVQVIQKALEDAQLQPNDINYVEAHGTGTKIGDPIEVEALNKVFGTGKTKDDPLLIGSVKSNFGHLESAAGMASIIKAVLCLQHKQVPQSIHFKNPNELIAWQHIPVKVANNLVDLKGEQHFIGTSGFGITGTNGHLILGSAPAEAQQEDTLANPEDLFVLPLTAKSSESLQDLAKAYSLYLKSTVYDAGDVVAFTALKRAHFDTRETLVASTKEELIDKLDDLAAGLGEQRRKFDADDVVKKVFVFSGQGAQWAGMGIQLAKHSPVFKEALEACNSALKPYVDWDLFEELEKKKEESRLVEGDVMQPLLMAIGIATAKWWMSKGISPDLVIGHSMGEIAAAHIGGHLSLEDAARIITSRSQLMEKESGKGVMSVTDLSEEEAVNRIRQYNGKLSVAVMNSPSVTVIGGDPDASKLLAEELENEGRFCRKVRMTVAAHTAQMDPVLEPLREKLTGISPVNGHVPFYSATLAKPVEGAQLDPGYWVGNVRNPVKFGEAIRKIAAKDDALFIEVGPHAVLTAAMEENLLAEDKTDTAHVVSSFYRGKDERISVHENLGRIFRAGIDLDWSKVHHPASTFVELPTYQWQKERYWFDETPNRVVAPAKSRTKEDNTIYAYEWEEVATLSSNSEMYRILVVREDGTPSDTFCGALQNAGHKVEVTTPDNVGTAVAGSKIERIVFIEPEKSTELTSELENGCLALQKVLRQVSDSGKTPKLEIITQNALGFGHKELNPSSSMLWGMARTVRNEFPELSCTCIDVDDVHDKALITLISAKFTTTKEFRIRKSVIHQPRLIRAENNPAKSIELNSQSCYLITGGSSGLGLAFGAWLARKGTGKLALVSRSGEKPETAATLKAIRDAGTEVKVFRADVSVEEDVKKLIAEVESALGKITGVIHAAGLVDDGTLLNLSREQFLKVAKPKVTGSLNLHNAFLGHKLNHFVVFSSAATVLGTVGQANYNAANFYMDQLMTIRSNSDLAGTSVCWGNIGGTGMAAEDAKRGERLGDMGLRSIDPEDFDTYFELVFNTALDLIIPLRADFRKWAQYQPAIMADATFEQLTFKQDQTTTDQATEWGNNPITALRKLKEMIKRELSGITRMPVGRLKEDDTFKSMGVDSMLALQLKNKIQELTKLNLPVSSVWAHPTISKYAEFLISQLDFKSDTETANTASFTTNELKGMIKTSISGITKLAPGKIRETDTFKSMGIDSMQALQIRNQLQVKTGISLAVSSIWAHPTVEKYTAFLSAELDTASSSANTEAETSPSADTGNIEGEVEDMSLDELMKQLDDKSKEY
ncbi:MAG: type I polyketide synthase [Bacteroidetes bacterium]|nr:type I polyketide synthase [Bacteroidota bacterium]